MSKCEINCSGLFRLTAGSQTKNGRPTWNIYCEAGQAGGCKGPNYDELGELSRVAGRKNGVKKHPVPPRYFPLSLSDSLKLLSRVESRDRTR